MPNWTDNVLTVTGKPEVIETFLAAVKSEKIPFDFTRIIPRPKLLDHTASGSRIIDGEQLRTWYVINPELSENEMYLDSNNRRFTPEEQQELDALGVSSWYDWALSHWGTKWNACEGRINEPFPSPRNPENSVVVIEFETAWSAPRPILDRLRATYRLMFRLRCHYEDDEPDSWETI